MINTVLTVINKTRYKVFFGKEFNKLPDTDKKKLFDVKVNKLQKELTEITILLDRLKKTEDSKLHKEIFKTCYFVTSNNDTDYTNDLELELEKEKKVVRKLVEINKLLMRE